MRQIQRVSQLIPATLAESWSEDLLSCFDSMIAALRANAHNLAEIESSKAFKKKVESFSEINTLIDHFVYAKGLLSLKVRAMRQAEKTFCEFGDHEKIRFTSIAVPFGVVAIILPYNFPAVVLAERLPYALAAGNAVAVKPSEIASGAVLEIIELAKKIFGNCRLDCFPGDSSVGKALVESEYINMVSFTGGSEQGRKVAERCGYLLKPCSLELGGNNLAVIDDTADINQAIDHCATGITYHSGQCCISTRNILVPRETSDSFISALAARLRAEVEQHGLMPLAGSAPSYWQAVNRLQGESNITTIENQEGPDIVIVKTDKVAEEEIFGPVVSVLEYDASDLESLLSQSAYGLGLQIFSKKKEFVSSVIERTRAGRIWVNASLVSDPSLRLGGFGSSGNSWIGGQNALDDYSAYKALALGPIS